MNFECLKNKFNIPTSKSILLFCQIFFIFPNCCCFSNTYFDILFATFVKGNVAATIANTADQFKVPFFYRDIESVIPSTVSVDILKCHEQMDTEMQISRPTSNPKLSKANKAIIIFKISTKTYDYR